MQTISVRTRKKDEIVDITEMVASFVRDAEHESGVCIVFAAHTTCAITTADLDPGTDLDFLNVLRHILPQLSYHHPHDPAHAPDHILSSIIGPSVIVPYEHHQLVLGVWQRIVLVELDGPRQRNVKLSSF